MCPYRAALLAALLAPLPLAAQQLRPPVTEAFDTAVPPALPPGWTASQNRTPGTNDFTTNTSSARSAPNALLSTNATVAQHVATPLLDFTGRVPDSLVFHTRRSSTHLARLVVETSTDGGGTYTARPGDTIFAAGSTSYVRHAVMLPPGLAGRDNARLRWRVVPDASGTTGTLRIDDVSIGARQADDLALASLRFRPPRPREGEPVTAAGTVRNAGFAPAAGYALEVYVDADNDSIPSAAERVGTVAATAPLAPGDSAVYEVPLPVQPPGSVRCIGLVVFTPDGNPANNRSDMLLETGAGPGSVAVNEVMYAPAAPEPEWVEIVSVRSDTLDLGGWSVSDNQPASRHGISARPLLLPPGAHLVLTGDSLALREARPGIHGRIVAVAGFPALNNTGDAVVLFDAAGLPVDSIAYLPSWGGSAEGRSLERIDALAGPLDPRNWNSSLDSTGATPGRANSIARADTDLAVTPLPDVTIPPGTPFQPTITVRNAGRTASPPASLHLAADRDGDSVATADERVATATVAGGIPPGDSTRLAVAWPTPVAGRHTMIALLEPEADQRPGNNAASFTLSVGAAPGAAVVNEIMFDPRPGGSEYLEVVNAGKDTLDLAGWTVKVGGGASPGVYPLSRGSRPVGAGGAFVLASDTAIYAGFPWVRLLPHALAGGPSLGLNNDGDVVVLCDPSGRTVDSLAYLPAWHNPGVADPAARSLERIHPSFASADRRSWSTSAAAEGGTPGRANSILAVNQRSSAVLSFSPNPFSPDGDGFQDFAVIRYELPPGMQTVTVRIFDARGRLIRRLAVNEPAAVRGEFVWDGRDEELRRARIGPYIVLLEGTDAGGATREAARGVVVLGAKM